MTPLFAVIDFEGHEWPEPEGPAELLLILTTRRHGPPLWMIVSTTKIVCAPSGTLPAPGEPLSRVRRLVPFPLFIRGPRCVSFAGNGRVFGSVNEGKICLFWPILVVTTCFLV